MNLLIGKRFIRRFSQSLVFFLFALVSLSGCVMPSPSGWSSTSEVTNVIHPVNRPLTEEKVKQAILDGTEAAVGWQAEVSASGRILATYGVRSHTIQVEIQYTDTGYQYLYKDSDQMKMYCTQKDFDKRRIPKVSGRDTCPGGGAPVWLHANYRRWISALDASIQSSLASI